MRTSIELDPVLSAPTPDVDERTIIEIAARDFGVDAQAVRDLGSERDRTFLLLAGAERPIGVLKVSNAAESAATLDMEALAVLHAARTDPGLPLALPRRTPGADGTGADTLRTSVELRGAAHHVRLYDLLPGRRRVDARELADPALVAWGETGARLGRALRGFSHPAAHRSMLWDIQHAARTRSMLDDIVDPSHRDLVARVLDRFDEVVAPAWPTLRMQIVHTDLTTDNALTDPDGLISGIVDFGDMCHTALITDIAGMLESLVNGRTGDDLFRVIRLFLDGYQRVTALEPMELDLVGEVVATRAAVTIAISSWRSAGGLEDPTFARRYNDAAAATIDTILTTGWRGVARRLGSGSSVDAEPDLRARRAAVLGPALEPLTYDMPIEMASASGVWMTGTDGRRYLDAYNNVPSVGHAHPRITEAISRQSRRLNTNLRYLHPDAVRLAERLVASCPSGLDTVLFVNSGSEANDLAWRLATTATGQTGGLCTADAYHGISAAIAPLSPETWPAARAPGHVETWPVFGLRGAAATDPAPFESAVARLGERGHRPAAAILDGVLTSDGYPTIEPDLVRAWVDRTHRAGGLWIADEVQGGHGRTGLAMWSFERFGIEPDIVTLGKPMGNGHPIGAVITRRSIVQAFADETVFFSTFGGNPVSMAAGLAVLDVIDDERIIERTRVVGAALVDSIRAEVDGHPAVIEIRGVGLAIGVEFADAESARSVREGMRARGVLVGTCGHDGQVLKVRPPLALTLKEVPLVASALGAAVTALGEAWVSRDPA
jgi:4-aminobutyrate aminotransferase-like enzyme/Ser/Thr protein kinase RdoA (MazF antagonist)